MQGLEQLNIGVIPFHYIYIIITANSHGWDSVAKCRSKGVMFPVNKHISTIATFHGGGSEKYVIRLSVGPSYQAFTPI
jgi:hypothetical protein